MQMAGKVMKAVQYSGYGGGAAALQYVDAPIPTPKKGELLIKLEATGLNPVDWKIQKGQLRPLLPSKFPFIPDEWRALTISRKSEAQAICRLVSYQESFWAGVEEVCNITEPLVKVLRLVDGEKPAMGYLYEAMDRAKEAVRSYYDDKGDDGFQRQLLLWEVIDDRWNNTLHRPIHAAGLFLNPAFAYSCGFLFDAEVMDGFFTCVQKMVPNPSERAEISKEMEVYRMAGGTLSFDMAVQDRTAKMPDAWWRSYGGRLPKLQKLAIRILSQTCSASGCERNWSVFEKIHTKKRNRLEGQRLNDMVYVYYNLRLWVRQLERTPDMEAISLDAIDTTAEWRVEAERPVMESAPDWIEQEVVEGEDEEEDEEQQQQQQEEEEEQEEEVTPPTTTTGRGRGLPPLAPSGSGSRSGSGASFFSSRARQSPLPVPPASSSREKGKAVVFSRKRGRGNQ